MIMQEANVPPRKIRVPQHSKVLQLAGIGLSFLLGMAVMNGYATSKAVHEAVVDINGDCKWTLEQLRAGKLK